MGQLLIELNKRKKYLENLLKQIDDESVGLPEGGLRISRMQNIPRYYHMTKTGDTTGKYIKKNNMEFAKKLAQKDYLFKLRQRVEAELYKISEYIDLYAMENVECTIHSLSIDRQELVTPLVLTDEMFVSQWEQEVFISNPYHLEEKVYLTQKEELVRSKSELMIANMYYELNIPYRYEAELCLKNGKVKFPDFTLLNVNKREVIYHEHFGLLDDETYRKANFNKLDEYRKNGIYIGKNLILTYEAEGSYLNICELKQMCREIFLMK